MLLDIMFHANWIAFLPTFFFFLLLDAFNTEQLLCSMEMLKNGQAVDIPKYDFRSYKHNVLPTRRVQIFYLWSVKDVFYT